MYCMHKFRVTYLLIPSRVLYTNVAFLGQTVLQLRENACLCDCIVCHSLEYINSSTMVLDVMI